VVNIEIDGVQIGKIDPDDITIGDQIELEEAKGAKQIVTWLRAHAGTDDAAVAKLVTMKLRKMRELATSVGEALLAAAELPN
jgi:hypothetical protein